jgi:hypothetical protein
MKISRLFALLLLCGSAFTASICHAQEGLTTSTWAGCKVQARAYIDPTVWQSSRFDMTVVNPAEGDVHWDFTLDWEHTTQPYYYTGLSRGQSRLPYGKAKQTTIHATLFRYSTLEERVTFHNLDLCPLATDDNEAKSGSTPRFLALKSAVTATTPSGIQITLPAQNVKHFHDMFSNFNGNPNALFIRIETTPDQREVVLPLSPLYQKYHKPLSIQLACDQPDMMVFYQADNTDKTIAVGLPNLRTVMHLDFLTIVVRQRVNTLVLPIAVRLPVSRPLPSAGV